MNQPADTPIDHNLPIVSVSELSAILKAHIEDRFDHVRIRGEISGLHRAASGHVYFSLKDEKAVLESACWRPVAARLPPQLADGADVIVRGRITTYPSRSRYQLIVETLELAGVGALLQLLEERKQKLAAEGLFAAARKRRLPYLPECIGVITSPSGAVIRDILHRLQARFPRKVLVWPVAVQGQEAAAQIATALEGFSALDDRSSVPRPDLLIIARGGGSLEDLLPFNEEVVVRAVAASKIPTVSAVGHETDTTLIDFAADLRAPTPTAAAELSVPVRHELLVGLLAYEKRLIDAANRTVAECKFRLSATARGLARAYRMPSEFQQQVDLWGERLRYSPKLALNKASQTFSAAARRLIEPNQLVSPLVNRLEIKGREFQTRFQSLMAAKLHTLQLAGSLLESYSHKKTLARGFAIVDDGFGRLITTAKSLRSGEKIRLQFVDGYWRAVAIDRRRADAGSARSTNVLEDQNQGSLL